MHHSQKTIDVLTFIKKSPEGVTKEQIIEAALKSDATNTLIYGLVKDGRVELHKNKAPAPNLYTITPKGIELVEYYAANPDKIRVERKGKKIVPMPDPEPELYYHPKAEAYISEWGGAIARNSKISTALRDIGVKCAELLNDESIPPGTTGLDTLNNELLELVQQIHVIAEASQ